MRQYSNFLLFEGLLDSIPNTIPAIYNLAREVTQLTVRIVAADCNTYLGEPVNIDYDREGDIETVQKTALTSARITTLLSQGTTKGFVRKVHNCTAQGGVCQLCYKGTYQYLSLPVVGSQVTLTPEYVSFNDILVGDGVAYTYQLTPPERTLSRFVVFYNGAVVASNLYSVDQTTWKITFTSLPVKNGKYVVKQYRTTNDGLLTYFANTYSSALFGIKPIKSYPPLVRESYYSSVIKDTDLEFALLQLKTLPVPGSMIDYYSKITSRLEKALFIIYLYVLYVSVLN